ncbi:MAG: hypothetical protein RIF41_40590, partial [Polyangiaceae bacterium]
MPDCAPDEVARWDGGCTPAGAQGCADGFESDGEGGCVAVVPKGECPLGQMKILGEARCVDVAPCTGRWGAAPVDAQTVFVDASFLGGTSDGSEGAPFTVLADAVAATPVGGTIAIAAGDYDRVEINAPLDLWGACPAEVRIHGGMTAADSVAVFVAASSVGVHDLTITDSRFGVVAVAPNLTLERVVIHDLSSYGLWVDGDFAPGASATVRRSSFVRTTSNAMAAFDASILVEDVHVDDTRTNDIGESGRGLATRPGLSHAEVAVDGLVVERSRIAGVFLR